MARKTALNESKPKRLMIKSDQTEKSLIMLLEMLLRVEMLVLPFTMRTTRGKLECSEFMRRSNLELLRAIKLILKGFERASRKMRDISRKATIIEIVGNLCDLQYVNFPDLNFLRNLKIGPRMTTLITNQKDFISLDQIKTMFTVAPKSNVRTRTLLHYGEKALLANRNPQEIQLQGDSGIGQDSCVVFLMRNNPNIATVDLLDTQIKNVHPIASALKSNRGVKRIDLGYNPIGKRGALALSDTLKVNPSLNILELEGIVRRKCNRKMIFGKSSLILDGKGATFPYASYLSFSLFVTPRYRYRLSGYYPNLPIFENQFGAPQNQLESQ
mmetsp:Transcript_58466/g.66676  ORF Transcript_58466/g.66676 Transcript_58466/m.66676 type:complete len:328 (-) Transcript_58466:630-1613(-)